MIIRRLAMIDTIKLLFTEDQYQNRNYHFKLSQMQGRMRKGVLNPTKANKDDGIYVPKLTLIEQPHDGSRRVILTVEFSAPKLLRGNNFEELNDDDLNEVAEVLSKRLADLHFSIPVDTIRESRVVGVHFSKNLKLPSEFDCAYVIDRIRRGNISSWYDRRTTSFDGGTAFHIHTNTKDLVFYDKVADLYKGLMSEKRSFDKDAWINKNLLDSLKFDVLRFEVRLNGATQIRKELGGPQTLEQIFKWGISKDKLIKYWRVAIRGVDKLPNSDASLLDLLQAHGPHLKQLRPRSALAMLSVLYMGEQSGISELKETFKRLYGPKAWDRVQSSFNYELKDRSTLIDNITNQLDEFKRVSRADI